MNILMNFPALDSTYMDVVVACESTEARQEDKDSGLAYKTHPLRVHFTDVCGLATITPAISGDQTIPLYRASAMDMAQASINTDGCHNIYNELVPVATDAVAPAAFSTGLGSSGSGIAWQIFGEPSSKEMLGAYSFRMRSCITYGDGSQVRCAESDVFVIRVVDPCVSTSILSAIFDEVMTRPQLQTQTLNLRDAVPLNQWGWKVRLDTEKDAGKYPYPLCGDIEYMIVTDEPVPQATNLVTKTGDILTFAPNLNHAPGIYNLLLVGRLIKYNKVQKAEQFSV